MIEARNEKLLSVWLRLTSTVCNDRIVSDLPFNEALICNLLDHSTNRTLTATKLCAITGMLKSQMNRTLSCMEKKGLIRRERSENDKRQIRITLIPGDLYEKQHAKSLAIVDKIIERFGEEQADSLIRALSSISDIAQEVL